MLVLIDGLFVRSIVGPLARLGEAVAATGDGSARTVTPEGPKEVRRLAERHNTMLAQLAAADSERHEMLAGLTHDLRAPLARLRVRLAFLRSEESSARPAPPLWLADALRNEVARHRELGRPVSMTVSEAAAACQVSITPGNLQRLLDNLIDNVISTLRRRSRCRCRSSPLRRSPCASAITGRELQPDSAPVRLKPSPRSTRRASPEAVAASGWPSCVALLPLAAVT